MHKNEIKVSLIITVYNREQTIKKCIESALNQTLKDIEIIIVDDCSIDQSSTIVQEYAHKYKNIIFLKNEKNMGPGYSKNRGLGISSGEFVTFLDSDDYLSADYLEKLYTSLQRVGADIAVADMAFVEGTKINVHVLSESNLFLEHAGLATTPLDKPSIISGLVVAAFWGGSSACTKLARRELWLRFPFHHGRRCDDLPAVLPMLAAASRIVYVPGCQYYYVQNEASVEHEYSIEKDLDALEAINETLQRFITIGAEKDYSQILAVSSLFEIIHSYLIGSDFYEINKNLETLCSFLNKPPYQELLSEKHNPFWKNLKQHIVTSSKQILLFSLPLIAEGESQEFSKNIIKWRNQKNNFHPKVSIIIPVYNGADYLQNAIDSALAQTYRNIEVIVINDGSCDGGETERIALSFGNRIHYYWKENGGVATALNLGIEKMTGEYFSWLSHDDMYTPEKIEQELHWLTIQPDRTTIIVEGYQVVDAAGKYLYTVNLHDLYTAKELEKPLFSLFRGGINGCSLLIHRSHFNRVGLFDPGLPTTQDYDLWFRMFRGQRVFYATSSNVLSRCHEKQGSKVMFSAHASKCDQLWIGMMDGLTDQERIEQAGSVYLFFKGIRDFLKSNTGYHGAIEYASYKTFRIAVTEFDNKQDRHLLKEIAEDVGYDIGLLDKVIYPLRQKKQNKSRILFLLPSENDHEANRKILLTSTLLTDQYDVIVIHTEKIDPNNMSVSMDIQEVYIPCGLHKERGYVKLSFLLGADVIVLSNNCNTDLLSLHKEAKQLGIKSIAWNHDSLLPPYQNEKSYGFLQKRIDMLAEADAVVWNSQFNAEVYGLFQENGLCIPAIYLSSEEIPIDDSVNIADHKRLLFIGNFSEPNEEHNSFLRMLSLVFAQEPQAEIFIDTTNNGDKNFQPISRITFQKVFHELHVPEENLYFVDQADKFETLFQKATVLVLPSSYERLRSSILTAAAYGVPTIIYGGSIIDDIITDGRDGIIVPDKDWNRLGKEVLAVIKNTKFRTQLSAGTRQLFIRNSPDNIRALWCDVVQTVLHNNPQDRNTHIFSNYRKPFHCPTNSWVDIIQLYDKYISELKASITTQACASPNKLNTNPTIDWAAECFAMQQTLSWRITKCFRLVKKAISIWKDEGFVILIRKLNQKRKERMRGWFS